MQGIQETREAVVELSVREVPADHEILLREAIPNAESGLHVLAREHKTFEEYVNEVCSSFLLLRARLTCWTIFSPR